MTAYRYGKYYAENDEYRYPEHRINDLCREFWPKIVAKTSVSNLTGIKE